MDGSDYDMGYTPAKSVCRSLSDLFHRPWDSPGEGMKTALVTKKGGRCVKCAARQREVNYITKGIRHKPNLSFSQMAKLPGHLKGGMATRTAPKHRKNNAHCPDSPTGAHHQIIRIKGDGNEAGICKYCLTEFPYPPKKTHKELYTLESNRKGGHISGKMRGGSRGRPRGLG